MLLNLGSSFSSILVLLNLSVEPNCTLMIPFLPFQPQEFNGILPETSQPKIYLRPGEQRLNTRGIYCCAAISKVAGAERPPLIAAVSSSQEILTRSPCRQKGLLAPNSKALRSFVCLRDSNELRQKPVSAKEKLLIELLKELTKKAFGGRRLSSPSSSQPCRCSRTTAGPGERAASQGYGGRPKMA